MSAIFDGKHVLHVANALFFDSRGNGPDHAPVGVEPREATMYDGMAISEPGIWLVVGRDSFGNMVSNAGGYSLSRAGARKLRDQLTAWLDTQPECKACGSSEIEVSDGGNGNTLERPCSHCVDEVSS